MRFQSVREDRPGPKWKALFERSWPAYHGWFLREGDDARADLDTSREMIGLHMPELEPVWDELVALSGGGAQAARMLALVNPVPFISGCSQLAWTRGAPALIRNYDYHPRKCEGTLLLTCWTGTRVMASSDCLWGVLDGMNEHGVCVALAFGGCPVVGEGFGIPLILRYVLETSRSAADAVGCLTRVPSHMAYNVSVLDRTGVHCVVEVGPGLPAQVQPVAVATNWRDTGTWVEYEAVARSEARRERLAGLVSDPSLDVDALTSAFLEPPLFGTDYRHGFGTLYTARYEPESGRATWLWPDRRWVRSFDDFPEEEHIAAFEHSDVALVSLPPDTVI